MTIRFVGLGPGDPDLTTARAIRHLVTATRVLAEEELWAAVRELAPRARLESPPRSPLEEARVLAELASQGEIVCRAYKGDPLVGSAAARVIEALGTSSVSFTVAPGLVPELATASLFGAPFFRIDDPTPSYAVVVVEHAHIGTFEWEKLATVTDTLVLDVALSDVAEIARTLTFHGRSPHAAVLCVTEPRGGAAIPLTPAPADERKPALDRSRVWTGSLDALARAFAVEDPKETRRARIVVGPGAPAAARFRQNRPLVGKRVLVTHARAHAEDLAARLRDEGAEPVFFPVLDFDPSDDKAALARACDDLAKGHYTAVLFTSQRAVASFTEALRKSGRDARAYGSATVGAIGPATAAALERAGIVADFVAKEHVGEGLADETLRALGSSAERIGGVRVLLPRAKVARDVLPRALEAAGFVVEVVTAYVTRAAEGEAGNDAAWLRAALSASEIDVVTLASSSAASHLVAILGPEAPAHLTRTLVASLGQVTRQTAEDLGLTVAVTARTFTAEGLVLALREHFAERSPMI